MNEVKIDGILCNKKEAYTQSGKCITSFGLNFYNGKKDGKSVYDFIDCKMFDRTDLKNKDRVQLTGWLGVESWEKDGKTNKKVVFYARELVKSDNKAATDKAWGENVIQDDCSIPF
jgi:hypothetical protein